MKQYEKAAGGHRRFPTPGWKKNVDYTLYLCTDRSLMSSQTLEEGLEAALQGGCTLVQLREKECSSREFYRLAVNIKRITAAYNVPLIINDRVDVALAAGADGVHVGQEDLPVREVRQLLGEERLLGVSASTLEEAQRAQSEGADYLGVGAMYQTATKSEAAAVSMAELRAIRQAVTLPLVVIGGINEYTAEDFRGTGIDGFAVVSALIAQRDIRGAAARLARLFGQVLEPGGDEEKEKRET